MNNLLYSRALKALAQNWHELTATGDNPLLPDHLKPNQPPLCNLWGVEIIWLSNPDLICVNFDIIVDMYVPDAISGSRRAKPWGEKRLLKLSDPWRSLPSRVLAVDDTLKSTLENITCTADYRGYPYSSYFYGTIAFPAMSPEEFGLTKEVVDMHQQLVEYHPKAQAAVKAVSEAVGHYLNHLDHDVLGTQVLRDHVSVIKLDYVRLDIASAHHEVKMTILTWMRNQLPKTKRHFVVILKDCSHDNPLHQIPHLKDSSK